MGMKPELIIEFTEKEWAQLEADLFVQHRISKGMDRIDAMIELVKAGARFHAERRSEAATRQRRVEETVRAGRSPDGAFREIVLLEDGTHSGQRLDIMAGYSWDGMVDTPPEQWKVVPRVIIFGSFWPLAFRPEGDQVEKLVAAIKRAADAARAVVAGMDQEKAKP